MKKNTLTITFDGEFTPSMAIKIAKVFCASLGFDLINCEARTTGDGVQASGAAKTPRLTEEMLDRELEQ